MNIYDGMKGNAFTQETQETQSKQESTSTKSPDKVFAPAESSERTLVRLDLMFTQAMEEDILEEFDKYQVGQNYSKTSNVIGKGCSNPKMGDSIWPQLNSMYVIFCSMEEAQIIRRIVIDLRLRYPMEGIACFVSSATAW